MIKRLDISGVHYDVDKKLKAYVVKKIGKLDHFISKHARESVHAEIILEEKKIKAKKECVCEVIMHLPKETITAKEATVNMFAAVDIVEAKLKNQLKKYKELHGNPRFHRRLIGRLRNIKHQGNV